MTSLTIYNGCNSQDFTLTGLVDDEGNAVTSAEITAQLTRNGTPLIGSSMTFSPVDGVPGNYSATLGGFDAPPGPAQLQISGVNSGATFNFSIFATIAQRSL